MLSLSNKMPDAYMNFEKLKEEFPMSEMDKRGDAFENKFAHDAELRFKATARRNKLLGHWAAEQLGRQDVEAYAQEVVRSDFEEPGDEDVIRKLRADFDNAGVDKSDDDIRGVMADLMATATEQVQNDT